MTVPDKKIVIIVVGPTAVGKTAVAIELAKHYKTEIISADSRQCYKELKIGVARPSEEELQSVSHHFIATHNIHEEVTAADFECYALDKTKELFQQHDVVLMVGGTGLYIKAFEEGLHEIPPVDPEIRANIINQYEEKGLGWLQDEIRKKDPAFYASGEIKNPQRIMRALEVVETTGRSILDFRRGKTVSRDFNTIKIGLTLSKEELHGNINERVDKMMEQGLVEEARKLIPFKDLNALQTVGYKELFDHFDGIFSLDQAFEQIKQHTRQYAKRQLTWFRKDKSLYWFHPKEIRKIIEILNVEI